MESAVVPAILAYKAGELFANIIRIVDEIPPGRNLSVDSLELVLRKYVSLSVPHQHELTNFSAGQTFSTRTRNRLAYFHADHTNLLFHFCDLSISFGCYFGRLVFSLLCRALSYISSIGGISLHLLLLAYMPFFPWGNCGSVCVYGLV